MICPYANAAWHVVDTLARSNTATMDFRSVNFPPLDCDPATCALAWRCLQPDRWQVDSTRWSDRSAQPVAEPPEGFAAAGPWEPFSDDETAISWRRPLRRVVLHVAGLATAPPRSEG